MKQEMKQEMTLVAFIGFFTIVGMLVPGAVALALTCALNSVAPQAMAGGVFLVTFLALFAVAVFVFGFLTYRVFATHQY